MRVRVCVYIYIYIYIYIYKHYLAVSVLVLDHLCILAIRSVLISSRVFFPPHATLLSS